VKVVFRTRKLEKEYADGRLAIKAYGEQVGRKYVQRVSIIRSARDFETLKGLPGLNCHSLKGDRKGQWAIKLTGFMRLIVRLVGDAPEIVRVEEVSKHYDD
jgi:toxin HigB-1